MSQFLYYVILKPLSLLPLAILYRIADIGFIILYYFIGYRKDVVLQNLNNSFPDKSKVEINQISREFYRHLCDLVVESIRLFSMPEKEALKRCKCRNPELLNQFYDEGKTVVLGCGHYNNWELLGVSFAGQIKHKVLCIYSPLSNAFFDNKMRTSRGKYGANLMSKKELKPVLEENKNTPCVIVFGTDQNPSPRSNKLYWTDFMNQDTAVNFGLEKYAKDDDLPALFMKVVKIKRGYYEFDFELITDNPTSLAQGEITNLHTQILEKQIKEKPQFWLWTHKRWKRKR